MRRKRRILVVDDEKSIVEMLSIMFHKEGYEVVGATSAARAIEILDRDKEQIELVVSDIKMPKMSGIELLKKIRMTAPVLPVIFITAYASLETAVDALRLGAFDYITKPFKKSLILSRVKNALALQRLASENIVLKETIAEIESGNPLDAIVGTTPAIVQIKELAEKVAPLDANLLITGESGTGKGILAYAIHKVSQRAEKPFLSINCGAIPKELLESELFGHKKGAYTGAHSDKDGLMKTVSGGTLLLDEIGETDPTIQVKLLKAIEEHQIMPVGSTKPEKIDVRIIAATNADLERLAVNGEFRLDLFYRLNVFHIHLPPLRERKDDIIPIAKELINRLCKKRRIEPKKLDKKAAKILELARWDGNIRELENVLERAILLTDGDTITPDCLPDYLKEKLIKSSAVKTDEPLAGMTLHSMNEIERAYIHWVLTKCGWNKTQAAKILGIDASTLYRKIEKYGLKKFEPQKKKKH